MATEPPSADRGGVDAGARPPIDRASPLALWIVVGVACLSVGAIAALLVLGVLNADRLTLATRALGYSAACAWLAVLAACGYALLRRRLEHDEGEARSAAEPQTTSAAAAEPRDRGARGN